jgi:Arc/MetJ family transcription regulator
VKTTVDIPDELLKSVMKATGSRTIRGAVVAALEAYHQRARQRELIPLLGTLKNFMTPQELREMRESREKRHDHRRQQLVGRNAPSERQSRGPLSRRKSA